MASKVLKKFGNRLVTSVAGLGFGLAGAWLIFLYFTFVSLVVLSLGAHQLQYAIRSYQIEDGKPLPLWAINRIHSNLLKAEANLRDLEFNLIAGKDDLRIKISIQRNALNDQKYSQSQYISIVKDVTSAAEKSKELEEQYEDATKSLDSAIQFQGKVLSPSVGDFVNAMVFFRNLDNNEAIGSLIPDFTSFPPEVLTVLLVLSMGALGGTIHLTRLYFDERSADQVARIGAVRGISYYIFRPALGAITALAVYILAKAGVLVVAAPSEGATEATLSPFFVSFLGIISGLLAEQALNTIQRTGMNWFAEAEAIDHARWGFGLKQHLRDEDVAPLADVLGVPGGDLRSWIDEKSQVSEKAQAIIAAWLRKPVRELFTDIGPGA